MDFMRVTRVGGTGGSRARDEGKGSNGSSCSAKRAAAKDSPPNFVAARPWLAFSRHAGTYISKAVAVAHGDTLTVLDQEKRQAEGHTVVRRRRPWLRSWDCRGMLDRRSRGNSRKEESDAQLVTIICTTL